MRPHDSLNVPEAPSAPLVDPNDARRGERLLWITAIADGDPFDLATAVLDRLELGHDERLLPSLENSDRAQVADHLGTLTSRRLGSKSIDLQDYVRLIGDPVAAIYEAFEACGADEIAAACYALMHDQLAFGDDLGHLGSVRAELRFCCARTLAACRPQARFGCRAAVTEILESGNGSVLVRDAMTEWLEGLKET